MIAIAIVSSGANVREGCFASAEGAQAFIDEVIALGDPAGVRAGRYQLQNVDLPDSIATVTISLDIENTYALYPDVRTRVLDAVIPAPPQPGTFAYNEWAQNHIVPWVGIGNLKGDSWYDVTVTACSNPRLIGTTFDFGY
jgi:hypothetical protein